MKTGNRSWMVLVALLAVLALVAVGCSSDDDAEGDTLTIVATTTIWGDVVSQIAGDTATVEVLMPVGADPHAYQASSQQAALVESADLVVANGLGLEEGLHDLLESAVSDGVNLFEVGPELNPIPFGDSEEDHDDEEGHDEDGDTGHDDDEEGHEHDHEADGDDPHVWLDPDRVALAAKLIAEELLEMDPEGPWLERANDYIVSLVALDEDLAKDFGALTADGRKMVTNHHSFGYFAERYNFTIVGVVVPGGSTLSDPSSQDLAALVETMEAENARTIYTETTEPSTLADAVAAELGEDVSVVELYTGSLGEAANGTNSYLGMMRENAKRIVEANS